MERLCRVKDGEWGRMRHGHGEPRGSGSSQGGGGSQNKAGEAVFRWRTRGREGASDVVVAREAATGDARHDGGCEMTRRREKRGDVPERMEEKRTAR
jgi:hypothetical protein